MKRRFIKPTKLEPPIIFPLLLSLWMLLWKNGTWAIFGLWLGYFGLMGVSLFIDWIKIQEDKQYLIQEMRKASLGEVYDINIWHEFQYLQGQVAKDWEESRKKANAWNRLKRSQTVLKALQDDYMAIEELCSLSWAVNIMKPEYLPVYGDEYLTFFRQKKTKNLINIFQIEEKIRDGNVEAERVKEEIIKRQNWDRDKLKTILHSQDEWNWYYKNAQLWKQRRLAWKQKDKQIQDTLQNMAEYNIEYAETALGLTSLLSGGTELK